MCEIYAYAKNLCKPGNFVGLSFHSANLSHRPTDIPYCFAYDLMYENV